MTDILEKINERHDFDRETKTRFGGSALRRCAAALTMWYQASPPQGSYSARCAIMANECAKAADDIERLQSELAAVRGKALEEAAAICDEEFNAAEIDYDRKDRSDDEGSLAWAAMCTARSLADAIRDHRIKPEENKDSSSSLSTETTS